MFKNKFIAQSTYVIKVNLYIHGPTALRSQTTVINITGCVSVCVNHKI